MKKLLTLLMLALCAFGCSAGPVMDEGLGAQQEALCTGGPVMTGSAGLHGEPTSAYVHHFDPWPGEAYSMKVTMSSGITGKISWGSTSGTTFRTTGCVGSDGPCVAWAATSSTSLKLLNQIDPVTGGIGWVSFMVDGVKVAELTGVNATTSLQNTKTYSGHLTRIRQDTGANSRLYFEGWDSGVWTSWSAKFFNDCGSIN